MYYFIIYVIMGIITGIIWVWMSDGPEYDNIYSRNELDVGVDTNNFYPYSLDELIAKLSIEININQLPEV